MPTWIKLNDNTPRHPKVAGLSDRAFRVWVSSICYASEFLTDGLVPVAFLVTVKRTVQDELLSAGLWHLSDDAVQIHDYLHHQTRKEDVEDTKGRNRDKAARYRARMKAERHTNTGDVTGDVTATVTKNHGDVTNPENREQIQRTENRLQNGHVAPLIMSPLAYHKRQQQCAFVGSRLEVPHVLHGDLRKMLGGTNAEFELQAWYADVNTEIELSGEAIVPDVFRWLKLRFGVWAKRTGEDAQLAAVTRQLEDEIAAKGRPS